MWIKSLSVAMKSRISNEIISSQLLGLLTDVNSAAMAQRLSPAMAQRLAKKTVGCQVLLVFHY